MSEFVPRALDFSICKLGKCKSGLLGCQESDGGVPGLVTSGWLHGYIPQVLSHWRAAVQQHREGSQQKPTSSQARRKLKYCISHCKGLEQRLSG